jgi:hypothetical protein
MPKVAVGVWAVLWLVATYGQKPDEVGAAGRSILMLTLGIAAAINAAWLTPRARALRASSPRDRQLHSILLCCATMLLVIHFAQAFRFIYASPTATTGLAWIDFLLIAVSTTMLLVAGISWPTWAPIFQASASTTMALPAGDVAKAGAQVARSPTTDRDAHAGNQPAATGGSYSGAPQRATAAPAEPSPKPKKARQAARAQPAQPHSAAAHSAVQIALRGTFLMAGFVAAMLVLPSLDSEHASRAARHASPAIEVCAQQKSLPSPMPPPPKVSPEHKGVAPSPPKSAQRSARTAPGGSQRDGASRAPP